MLLDSRRREFRLDSSGKTGENPQMQIRKQERGGEKRNAHLLGSDLTLSLAEDGLGSKEMAAIWEQKETRIREEKLSFLLSLPSARMFFPSKCSSVNEFIPFGLTNEIPLLVLVPASKYLR